MNVIDVLRQVEILSGQTEDQLRRLAGLAERFTAHAGDEVITEGDLPDKLFVIESGELVVIVESAEGKEPVEGIPLVTLGRGQIVGEISLVDHGPRSATVRCLSDEASLLAFDLEEVSRLLAEDREIGYLVMKNLAIDMAFKLRQRNIREKLMP